MWLRIKTTFRSLPRWQYAVLAIILGTLFLTLFGPHLGPYSSVSASPSDRLLPPSAGTISFAGKPLGGDDAPRGCGPAVARHLPGESHQLDGRLEILRGCPASEIDLQVDCL